MGKRVVRGKIKYLVKWKGHPESEQTYEPLEHLQHAMEEVQDFEKYSAKFTLLHLME